MGNRNSFFRRVREETKRVSVPEIGLASEKPILPLTLRGRALQTLYTAVKGWYERRPYRARTSSKASITCFDKTARMLAEYERKTGEVVDDAMFIVAQFRHYGKYVYPAFLPIKKALTIYQKYSGELFATLASDASDATDEAKLLKYLMAIRGEDENTIKQKFSELFKNR